MLKSRSSGPFRFWGASFVYCFGSAIAESAETAGLVLYAPKFVRVFWRLMNDQRMRFTTELVPFLGLILLLSPTALRLDTIPIIERARLAGDRLPGPENLRSGYVPPTSCATMSRVSREADGPFQCRSRNLVIGLAAILVVAMLILGLSNPGSWSICSGSIRSATDPRVPHDYRRRGARSFRSYRSSLSPRLRADGLIALGAAREAQNDSGGAPLPDEIVKVEPARTLMRTLSPKRMPWRILVIAAAAVLALFITQVEASSRDVYLEAAFGAPFNLADPAYGRDVGFYLFTLPLLEEMQALFLVILFLVRGAQRRRLLGAQRGIGRA